MEKRDIFLNKAYYKKFLDNLWDLNDTAPTPDNRIHRERDSGKREKLVEIYSYVLMPNHFHLVVRQLVDGGIEKLMRKTGVSYSMYFNIRGKRVGPLFQGRYKAKLVEDEIQLLQLIKYIHFNPLKLYQPDYPEVGIKNPKEALEYVKQFPWSSYKRYAEGREDLLIDDISGFISLGEGELEELLTANITET